MSLSPKTVLIAIVLLVSSFASAATLTGTVKNGTTGKPAAGVDVTLINVSQGMDEVAHTKADANGKFSLTLDSTDGPHLVRADHQGATYFHMAPPGTSSVEMEIYDAAKQVVGVSVTADVMRFQAQGNQLQGLRIFAIQNSSSPPRTQMSDHTFEFYMPEGAQIDQGEAMTSGGQPIVSDPVPQKEKNRYAFDYPLRPGETQFQVSFHLPYTGEANIDPKALYPAQHFVVMLPKTMQFTAGMGTGFQSMKDPKQSDTVVEVASNTQLGQPLQFKISGTGTLPSSGGNEQAGAGGQGNGGRDTRPGGGMAPPTDTPDPLENYRWYVLGGFALLLAGGGIYIAKRQPAAPATANATGPDFVASDFAASDMRVPVSSPMTTSPGTAGPAIARPAAGRPGSLLLEALKEELFELEVEHKQGRITDQEYAKAKAALDQTLERAIKRGAKSS